MPKLHNACKQKAMQGKRKALAGDNYINGTDLAKKLGIGRTTLNRWIKAGKLPKPEMGISGMMVFDRATVA